MASRKLEEIFLLAALHLSFAVNYNNPLLYPSQARMDLLLAISPGSGSDLLNLFIMKCAEHIVYELK